MEDMSADTASISHKISARDLAFGLAAELAAHKGQDVVVMDMAEASGWTDYFVLATATSSTHMRGLARSVEEYCASAGLKPCNRLDSSEEQSWLLVDLSDVIVHLMTAEARLFYELEKLWFKAPSTAVGS